MNTAVANKLSDSITLFVGNVADATDETDIRSLFAQYGSVSAIRLVPGAPNRRHDGHCYLQIKSRRAEAAISGLDGKAFMGSILRVEERLPHQSEPAAQTDAVPPLVPSVADEPPYTPLRCRYRVALVEKVDKASMPDGADGTDWYRYVLSSGNSQITGFHRGSPSEVTEYAENCAEEFNLRGIRGKSTRTMAPRKKK